MTSIYFNDLGINSLLLQKLKLKKFIHSLFKAEKKSIERVDIIFCSDEFLLGLNTEFLKHTYYTDTLTFVFSKANEPLSGEIYISIERIKVNSKNYRETYQNELARVIIHGCLHLCGYVDKPKNKASLMVNRQEKYLSTWFVSRET